MIGVLVLIILLFLLTQGIFSPMVKRHGFFDKKLMNKLFFYHLLFFVVYYIFALLNPSDSKAYFARPQNPSMGWFDFFGTTTTFIDFISYPFINYLNFNYEMMMFLFSWLGYLGFVYAYLFFRENIPIKLKVLKYFDFLTLLLFLPNMHFWTASLGKGAPIFLGLMMFAYAIKNPKSRIITLLIGSCLIYFIRPHVFLFAALGAVLGYMSGSEKISFSRKLIIYGGMLGVLFLVQDQILAVAGLEESGNIVEDFDQFSEKRASELGKAGSGLDISSYPMILKLFTFWFRPLFFDSPGIMGIIVSVENVIYLFLFSNIIRKDFINFVRKSPIAVKMSLVVFLLTSVAMTFVMSNLGIIIRQKSMVMYFIFFVIYYYMAQTKYDKIIRMKKLRQINELRKKKKNDLATF